MPRLQVLANGGPLFGAMLREPITQPLAVALHDEIFGGGDRRCCGVRRRRRRFRRIASALRDLAVGRDATGAERPG